MTVGSESTVVIRLSENEARALFKDLSDDACNFDVDKLTTLGDLFEKLEESL